ncbi:MAG: NADH-quinone oxidoreductase subunit NuoE [Nitrospirota bacterium]|jgi:NADH-quinone oxidoreductase subunit E
MRSNNGNGDIDRLEGVVSSRERRRALIIPSLHAVQHEQGFLPEEELERLSRELDIPLAEIFSVASFYHQFYFSPRGRKVIRVCTGTACHVRGAPRILNSLKEHFEVEEGETTENFSMTLETVGCVGCCGLAPVVTVNDEVAGEVESEKVKRLINSIENE